MTGAGAWKSPSWYGAGMPMPADERGRKRARLAMTGIQKTLIDQGKLTLAPGTPLDGGAGPRTTAAIKAHQKAWGLPQTGKIKRPEAFCLWFPILHWWQTALEIPDNLLTGMIGLESAFDPGAEGRVDPRDRGIGQFSSRWWPNVSDEMAYGDPAACIALVAHNLHAAHERFRMPSLASPSKTPDRLAWDAAVASHNNPAKAKEWADTGQPPDDQIRAYVRLVRKVAGRPV